MLKGINWVAVLIAVVLIQALGFLWFGMVFSDAWLAGMQAEGVTIDMSGGSQMTSTLQGVVLSLVTVVGIAWLMGKVGADGLQGGVMTALAAWFFFSLTTQAQEYVYMGFAPNLMAINVGYQLVAFVLAGAVLGVVKFGRAAGAAAAA